MIARRARCDSVISDAPIALLYDIHGNLPALEAVLAEAERSGVSSYLLGGDYAAFGPWPRENAALVETLAVVTRIRGNGERWLREEPEVPQSARQLVTTAMTVARESLGPALVDQLYTLAERAELDGILVCHGSPLSDVEIFAPDAQAGEKRMLAGEENRTILFGHSHQQCRRAGPNGTLLVNPGPAKAKPQHTRGAQDQKRRVSAAPVVRLGMEAEARVPAAWARLVGPASHTVMTTFPGA